MYIKWISDYAISKKLEGKRVLFRSLTPILAEAKRINGKPYSQNIKRLGTYYEYFGLRYRYAYWHQLEVRLINLGLSKEEIERLKSSVGKRIPPLTDEEINTYLEHSDGDPTPVDSDYPDHVRKERLEPQYTFPR
jgi:hypothetical protein